MRVLYDLYFGVLGYGGIPQDTRLLFKTLGHGRDVQVDGLIHARTLKSSMTRQFQKSGDLLVARVLNAILERYTPRDKQKAPSPKFLAGLVRKFRREEVIEIDPSLHKIPEIYHNAIWRLYLQRTLPPADRGWAMKRNYFLSLVPEDKLQGPDGAPPHLDTRGYDFLVFQDSRAAQVAPGTTKVVRYHDAIPLYASDTYDAGRGSDLHWRCIKRSGTDTHYVCNSEATRNELLTFFPEMESRTHVVPYTLPDASSWPKERYSVASILQRRQDLVALAETERSSVPQWRDPSKYVLMISTIEPRKNFIGAIKALEILRARGLEDLKLIIVGSLGWKYDETLKAMRAGIKAGSVFHVSGLDFAEILSLYENAAAVVFPSFAEGFGFTPMEAMQCSTPAVVSDIPAHRWVMEDAVLYTDPYDVGAIAGQLERLVRPESQSLRAELAQRYERVLSRYSLSTTSDQWFGLLERLKATQPN